MQQRFNVMQRSSSGQFMHRNYELNREIRSLFITNFQHSVAVTYTRNSKVLNIGQR